MKKLLLVLLVILVLTPFTIAETSEETDPNIAVIQQWWSDVKANFKENVFSPDVFIPFIILLSFILFFALRKAWNTQTIHESIESSYPTVLEKFSTSIQSPITYSNELKLETSLSPQEIMPISTTQTQNVISQSINNQTQPTYQTQTQQQASLQSLYVYINQARKLQRSELSIRQDLLRAGWPKYMVDTALFSKPKRLQRHTVHSRIAEAFSID